MLDNTPPIWSSFLPWLATAVNLARIPPSRILVHHACRLRPDIADLCERIGVRTCAVDPFDARSPHSNKIRQLETDLSGSGQVLLTDVDVVFTGTLPCEDIKTPVAGKMVDLPNPPLEVLEAIFARSGVPVPERCTNRFRRQGQDLEFSSFVGNFNGGLYLIRGEHTRNLGARWRYWAQWLLENLQLLGRWKVHVDQVSFCLALRDCGLASSRLGNEWNFPTHIEMAPANSEPYIIHHHARLDNHQRLIAVPDEPLRRAIKRVNEAIEKFQRRYFDNRTFWDHRYAFDPERGSGLGSRGETLALKRDLLSRVIPHDSDLSILDWGCGDLEVARGFPWTAYTGVDASVEALRIAREKRRDWSFVTPHQFDAEDRALRDLVFCIDVLIHQPTLELYRSLIDKVVSLARVGLLLSGYDGPPDIASHITYFHEPLGRSLSSRDDVGFVVRLTEYRDTAVYFVAKKRADSVVSDHTELMGRSNDPRATVLNYIRSVKVSAG